LHKPNHNLRQRTSAPPRHVIKSNRETYTTNILTASNFSHNNSQHFLNFTIESQNQWIKLLESYKDKKYQSSTPGYEEVAEILEKLCAVMLSQSRKKCREQTRDVSGSQFATFVRPTHRQSGESNQSSKLRQSSDHPGTLPQKIQAFRYPSSIKRLPRMTSQSFHQQIRHQGLEGVFVKFIPLASLVTCNPDKRHKEVSREEHNANRARITFWTQGKRQKTDR